MAISDLYGVGEMSPYKSNTTFHSPTLLFHNYNIRTMSEVHLLDPT